MNAPTFSTPVHFTPLDEIIVPEGRIRPIDFTAVSNLWTSFRAIGMIHPILLHTTPDGKQTLVVGGHRLAAFKHHRKQDEICALPPLKFAGQDIPPGTIPSIYQEEISPRDLLQMEIEENMIRVDIPLEYRVRALTRFHEIVSGGKEDASIMPTARMLVANTGASIETARQQVSRALVVARFLDDPEVAKADSLASAMNKVNAKVRREVVTAAHSAPLPEEGDTPHEFLEGDCKAVLAELPSNSFDLILSDPPYGVGADVWDQGNNQHLYEDTWENASKIYHRILWDGFRVCKEQANLFLFCDAKHFGWIVEQAALAGWRPFMSPIVWKKSTEGQAPWGTKGFIKTHEMLFFATKGEKGLAKATLDVLDFSRPDRRTRIHAAQKPVELISHLINISSLPGDRVLDPCAGSGVTFLAGWQTRTAVTGIELDPTYIPHCRKAMMERPSQQELSFDTSGPVRIPVGTPIDIEDL